MRDLTQKELELRGKTVRAIMSTGEEVVGKVYCGPYIDEGSRGAWLDESQWDTPTYKVGVNIGDSNVVVRLDKIIEVVG